MTQVVGEGLGDLKVIEIGEMVAVPRAGQLLADLGAQVIKVETPPRGDPARRRGPFLGDRPGPDRSVLFSYLNRNKQGITLNLGTATGRGVLDQLLEWSDVLIHDRPTATQEAIGLTRARLRCHPGLVTVAITPWGECGPYRHFRGRSLQMFHAGGLGYGAPANAIDPERPPLQGPPFISDYDVGNHAATAALAGVRQARATGGAVHLDIAAVDVAYSIVGMTITRAVESPRRRGEPAVGYLGGLFPCADGYVQLRILDQPRWLALKEVLGNPPWADQYDDRATRLERAAEVNAHLAVWAADKPKQAIMKACQERGVIAAAVHTLAEFAAWDQTTYRGFFQAVEQPGLGEVSQPTAPYRMSRTPVTLRRGAPRMGEHTSAVLETLLGYAATDIVAMRRAGVI